jgi:hypothetical protein
VEKKEKGSVLFYLLINYILQDLTPFHFDLVSHTPVTGVCYALIGPTVI